MSEKRSVTSSRSVRRSAIMDQAGVIAPVIDETLVAGNISRIAEAETLTLVGLPANQTGFKVVREDSQGAPKMIRRTKRGSSPVMKIVFPPEMDEVQTQVALAEYGLSSYRLERTEVDGKSFHVAIRSDLQSIAKEGTLDIALDKGIIATVARSAKTPAVQGQKAGITLAAIEFDGSKFTTEEVKRWQETKTVDGTLQEPQNPGESYVVRRSEIPAGDETRRMSLEDGVTLIIARSDADDVPAAIDGVSEAAYGCWGWGQLDFMALVSGQAYNEQMQSALYALSSVMEQIMLYSQLPLDSRKTLANKALGQFGEYIGEILDSLPRQLLATVARSAKPKLENEMTKDTNAAPATPTEVVAPVATVVETPATEASLTRADIVALIAETTKAAVKTLLRAQRKPAKEGTSGESTTAGAGGEDTDGLSSQFTDDKPAKAKRSDKAPAPVGLSREDLTASFKDAVAPMVARLEALEGTTIVRSAGEQTPTAVVVETPESKKANIFRGAIPGIRGRDAK